MIQNRFRRDRPQFVLLALFVTVVIGARVERPVFADAAASVKKTTKAAARVPNRPKVPGRLKMHLRRRVATTKNGRETKPVTQQAEWEAAKTVIIICDMWDGHYCKSSAQRVDAMAPKMNRVITAARNHGVMIIHAPSGTLKYKDYVDSPYRKRMQQARAFEPPVKLKRWCYLDRDKENALPIDDSKSPCDDPIVGERVRRYTKQHHAIKIIGYDGISDNGTEIYNFLRQEGITNIVLMGVHTNMCVLGRPFGIRQMIGVGMNVALVRDLTDAMYDPRQFPYVSHTRGTELVVEHIERFWCPSIHSRDLMTVIAGSDDPVDDAGGGERCGGDN